MRVICIFSIHKGGHCSILQINGGIEMDAIVKGESAISPFFILFFNFFYMHIACTYPIPILIFQPERYWVVKPSRFLFRWSRSKTFKDWLTVVPSIQNRMAALGNSHLEPMFLKDHLRPEAHVCYQGMINLIGWASNRQLMVLFLVGAFVFAMQFLFGELLFPQTAPTDDS